MGKRKSKKRKNKLNRPPKKKVPKLGIEGIDSIPWERPVKPLDYSSWEDEEAAEEAVAGQLDAPFVPWFTPDSDRPFGAVDPSMHGSTRYRKFRDAVAAIRDSVPDVLEKFATYDVPDLKQRRWLARYCLQKEAGKLPDWQQLILEKAGFNWKRGHPPVKKAPKISPERKLAKASARKAKQSALRETAWTKAYEALREACTAATPDLAMRALLQIDEAHYQWLNKQVLAARADKLKPAQRERLQALPFDFEAVVADRRFTQWRKAYQAYALGEFKHAERWATAQYQAREEGKMPAWRIEALDTINFDWEKAAPLSTQAKMEARWREKLETFLKLESIHGKPLNMQLDATKPLRSWMSRMREHYKNGHLSPELVAEFEAKGFEFSRIDQYRQEQEREWQRQFAKLESFKARFGHARVPSSYADDPEFGSWLAHQRESWKLGKLKPERIAKFKALGVKPTYQDESAPRSHPHLSAWLKRYRKLVVYLEAEYDGRLPKVGRIPDKDRVWLKRQRDQMQVNKLEPWQLEKLEAIEFNPEALPEPPPQVNWEERMERLRRFVREHGHARVARSCPDRKLYAFVQRVRKQKRLGQLSAEQERELKAEGFSFDPYREVSKAWMRQYEALQRYHKKNGDSQVPRSYPEDQGLAEFVAQQKQRGRKGMLLAEHIRLLDELDFPWTHGPPTPKDGAT